MSLRQTKFVFVPLAVTLLALCLTGCTTILLPTVTVIEMFVRNNVTAGQTESVSADSTPPELPALAAAQPDLPATWIDRNTLGNPDAPVVVEAYEDFLCSHCTEWTKTVLPQLTETYIQSGEVRFIFHNFPLAGFLPGSQMAALASQCAADQNAFWPYHNRLFAVQPDGQSAFTLEPLLGYASELGLDEAAFAECMATEEHAATIETMQQTGISQGVGGTPALYVNGNAVNSDFIALQAEIDRLLP